MENHRGALAPILVLAVAASACDAPDPAPGAAPFPTWEQSFEANADGWIGAGVDGPDGWCGSVERFARGEGPVEPAVGEAYAVARHGPCNEFWGEAFPAGGGPAATGAGLSDAWPAGGFEIQLDLHLDAAHAGPGAEIGVYAVAISLLDRRPDDWQSLLDLGFRYLFIPIAVERETVTVAGHRLDEPGWYTFRHAFREETDGSLAVDFELIRNAEVVLARPLEELMAFDEDGEVDLHPVSSLDAANVGSGYVRLDLAEGVSVPIDGHRVHPAALD